MGNKNVKRTQGLTISEWEMVSQGNKFNILKHKITNQQIEEYNQLFSDQKQFQKELNYFEKRLQQCVNVVQIKGWSDQQSKEMCSTFWNVKVYVQRIPKRLKNIHNLSLGKALWVLHQSINGFSNISKQYPNYFQISDGMICFDTEDNIKVWLNEDLSKNFPSSELSYKEMQPYAVQHKIIVKLIEIVQKHKEFRKFPNNFYSFIDKHMQEPYTFQQSMEMCQRYFDQENVEEVILPHQSQDQSEQDNSKNIDQNKFNNQYNHQLQRKRLDAKPMFQKQNSNAYIQQKLFNKSLQKQKSNLDYQFNQQLKIANIQKQNSKESPQQNTKFNPYNFQNNLLLNTKNTQLQQPYKYNPMTVINRQYSYEPNNQIMNKRMQAQFGKQQFNKQMMNKGMQAQFGKQQFNKQMMNKGMQAQFGKQQFNKQMMNKGMQAHFGKQQFNKQMMNKGMQAHFGKQQFNKQMMNKGMQAQFGKQQFNKQMMNKGMQAQFGKQQFNKHPQFNHNYYNQRMIAKDEYYMQYNPNNFPYKKNSQMEVQNTFPNKSIQQQHKHSNSFIGHMYQPQPVYTNKINQAQISVQPSPLPIPQPRSLSQMGISGPNQMYSRSSSNFNRLSNFPNQQNQQIKKTIQKTQQSFIPKSNQSNLYFYHPIHIQPKTIQRPIDSHSQMNQFINPSFQNAKNTEIHQIQYDNKIAHNTSLVNKSFENKAMGQYVLKKQLNYGGVQEREIGLHRNEGKEMLRVPIQFEQHYWRMKYPK